MKLNELVREAIAEAREKGWYDGEQTPTVVLKDLMLSVTEIAEAADFVRDGDMHSITYHADKDGLLKPEGFPIEMADAILRLCGTIGAVGGIDIEEAIKIKRAYNRQRPYKHGRKI